MRKLFALGLALLVTTGCDWNWDSPNFQYRSTLYNNTRGVALHDAAPTVSDFEDPWSQPEGWAQVGINGTTCEVDTRYASMSTDYDYPGSDEHVDDVGPDDNGDVTVVVTSDKGVHLQRSDDTWYAASEDYDVELPIQSRLFGDGAAVLNGDDTSCGVAFVGIPNGGQAHLKGDVCDGPNTIAVDPIAGVAFVGSRAGVYTVSPEVVAPLDEQAGDIVEWDSAAEVLYVAEIGGDLVRAVEGDGTERWATQIDGIVLALDDMGRRAQVAVAIQLPDGRGDLVVLDGFTGEYVTDMVTPSPAVSVTSSRDGQSLALTGDAQTHFYGVGNVF